jgi:hypothetical protein
MRTVAMISGTLLALNTIQLRSCSEPTLEELALRILNHDDTESAELGLRAAGPSGLRVLLAAKDRASLTEEETPRVEAAIDRVAGQRYGHLSRLYWYTDLEAAKADAQRTGRPILSLRLLGRLTDELSCANSRFFRTVLYVHPEIANELERGFVLHWSTEREAPVITIDFGDGRTLKRTITGNSIHYVLDQKGRVLDAIPGLYAPADFLVRLREAKLVQHEQRVQAILQDWSSERTIVPAKQAMFLATSKARIEAPMIMTPRELEEATAESDWDRMAARHPVTFAAETRALMRRENPALAPEVFDAMIARFERSIARDTVQNELLLHRRIHERLAASPLPAMEDFNRWVYAEIFQTPASDPWLGLHDDTIYTGLDRAGQR